MASKSGRFTPKKTPVQRAAESKAAASGSSGAAPGMKAPAYAQSGRYTPPTFRPEEAPNSRWVPILMFGLLLSGLLMIVLNYMNALPGATSNWYLIAGIGCIAAGFVSATQLR